MKNKKKLGLRKMSVAQLGSVKGGNPYGGYMQTANPDGCGMGTHFTSCLYSQTPMSCQRCVVVQ